MSGCNRKKCPICESDKWDIVKEISNKTYIFNVVKCQKCKFIYVLNPNFNTISTPASNIQERALPKSRHFQIKTLLDNYFRKVNSTVNILEIGSGYGALSELISNDCRYRYLGFEPSKDRAEFCQSKNLNVINDFFAETKANNIDAIILDNVLEHVLDPKTLVKQVYSCLNKNGIVIIIVPNVFDIRQFSNNWRKRHLWQPHCHINYFSSKSKKNVLFDNGFTPFVFPVSTIDWQPKHSLLILKTFLDTINLELFGLYCYGIKK